MIRKKLIDNLAWVLSIGWILAMMATGLVGDVGSLMGWLLVSVLAFGPATMLLYFGRELPLTTTQTIQRARR